MILARGIIRPNNYASHHHGTLSFHKEAPRRFVVDDSLEKDVDGEPRGKLEDEAAFAGRITAQAFAGGPLSLTVATYEALKAKSGGPIVVEPDGVTPAEVESLRAELAAAKATIADLEAQLAAKKK